MKLETLRLCLRDFTINDLQDLYEIFSDPEVMQHIEPAFDLPQTASFLQSFCIEREPKGAYAVYLKESSKVIGYILFKPLDTSEIYEIGWIFNRNYWRQGYASEICTKLIAYAFQEMQIHKICAEAIDIAKSVPLMLKLGFKEEGIQRKQSKNNQSEWCDLHWYGILAEDYFSNLNNKPKT